MIQDSIVKLAEPSTFADALTKVLRNCARNQLAQAVEAEVAEFLVRHAHLVTGENRRRCVRQGHLPEREIMTGIGPAGLRAP